MNHTVSRKGIVCELSVHLSGEETNTLSVRNADPEQMRASAQKSFVPGILEREHLVPVSPLTMSEELPEAGKPYDFVVRFETLPDIPLPERLDALSIDVPAPDMDGRSARRMAEDLRHSLARRSEVRERRRPVFGEIAVIDMNGSCGSCPAPGFQTRKKPVLLRQGGPLLPDIQNAIMEMFPGEVRTVTLVCPEDYPYVGMRGSMLSIELHLQAIFRETLPDIDAAFAAELGFDSVKALEISIMAKSMSNELAAIQKDGERRLLKKVLEGLDFEIPSYPERRFFEEFLQNARQALKRARCSDAQIEEQLRAMEDDMHRNAREQARSHVFLLALAEREHIRVSEQDMQSEIERMARNMKSDPAAVRGRLDGSGLADDVRERILAAKALTYLYNKAHKVVVDESGNVVPPPVPHSA